MTIEIGIYIIFAMICFIIRTIISGRKNGCFYHKNDKPLPPLLKKSIKNIHFIETPAWYAQTLGIAILIFAICRLINPTFELLNIIYQIIITIIIATGAYTAPSYHYQRGVTAGLRSDDKLDIFDGNKSEVALKIGNKVILQFWKKQLFYNKGRKLAQWVGIIEILIGVILMFILL